MIGVGNFNPFKKAAIRAPVNPYDKSTLINIYPKEWNERKITLMPSEYHIPAGSYENPSLVVIGPASWWRETTPEEPLLEITHASPVMAESIVRDAMVGMWCCNMHDTMPGFFWLPGEVNKSELKLKYKGHLDKARDAQHKYFQELINQADSLWSRTNGNPLAIHADAKLAAHALGQEKEWLIASAQYAPQVVRCVACGSMRNPEFPVCPTCKAVVDPDKAKELKLKFAE